jgi:hypothetical protein
MEKREIQRKKIVEIFPFNGLTIIRNENSRKFLKIETKKFEMEETTDELLRIEEDSYKQTYSVSAVYGIIKLVEDCYLVVAERSNMVAEVLNRKIYKAEQFRLLPLNKENQKKAEPKKEAKATNDHKFIGLITTFLNNGNFYFSDEYNLTNTLQAQVDQNFSFENSEQSFLINHSYAEKFMKGNINTFNYISPFILGFVTQKEITSDEYKKMTFTLISRKETGRLGSRFYSRGIDRNGNVSNFVETETIIEFERKDEIRRIFSHFQIRGSIPVYWTQQPTLRYTPKIVVDADHGKIEKAFKLHFNKLVRRYRKIQCVNLIDKQRSQKMIGDSFLSFHNKIVSEEAQLSGRISHEWFDYHHECRNMQVQNIAKLLKAIKDNLLGYGYFECIAMSTKEDVFAKDKFKFKVTKYQEGVVRTNCIDCLDRTNVFQSVVSRYVILNIFSNINLVRKTFDYLEPFSSSFERVFRDAWTDSGNVISLLYSGTPALKTDFTRLGKRTWKGMMDDSRNSITRYFINNFLDYETQNKYDMLTGVISIKNHPNYELNVGRNILKNLVYIMLIPFIVKIAFFVLNRRCTQTLWIAILLLCVTTAFFLVNGSINRRQEQIPKWNYCQRIIMSKESFIFRFYRIKLKLY